MRYLVYLLRKYRGQKKLRSHPLDSAYHVGIYDGLTIAIDVVNNPLINHKVLLKIFMEFLKWEKQLNLELRQEMTLQEKVERYLMDK